jgi:putative ABC transport system permease protein
MSWLNRFANFFRSRELDRDLEEELQFHFEARMRDNMAAGMSREQARRDAAARFGNRTLAKERTREANTFGWLESFARDLRHGCRMFAKNPGFTAVAVISLALGTGANTAMFSAADALVLRPLPVPHSDELVDIGSEIANRGSRATVTSHPNYLDIRDRSSSFQGVLAFAPITAGFAGQSGAPPQMRVGMVVSGNFFDVLKVAPQLGRSFRPDEDIVPGRDAVVILSDGIWEQLGSDPAMIGRTVKIAGADFTVIGILPDAFTGPDRYRRPAFYIPMMMWPRLSGDHRTLDARDYWGLRVKGRMKPGGSLKQVQAELDNIAKNLERAYPDTNRNQRLIVRTELQETLLENRIYTDLAALLTALAVALLIVACSNVAGLLTSRGPVRAREIGLRMAIGAGRSRLIRQLLTEGLLIAAAGGLLGLPLAYGGIRLLRQVQLPTDLVFAPVIEMDERALVFSLAVAMLSAILFGLIPAVQTTRADLTNALKAAEAWVPGGRRLWGRNLLVAMQVAVSLVLLTIAAFAYRMFAAELNQGMGFRSDHLVLMKFDPSLAGYDRMETRRFFERLAREARETAGVKSATLASATPILLPDTSRIVPEGNPFPAGQESASVVSCTTDEYYFATLNIPILRGRGFRAADTADAPAVAVVNETLARHYWPGRDALGKRFRLNDANGPWVEIVGVARNSRYLFIGEPPTDFVYFSYRQHPSPRMNLMAESIGESASLLAPLREMVRRLDPNMPVYDVQTMEEFYYARATSIAQVTVEIVGGMGLMGIALAMAGLYGLTSYSVSRRIREIGIRMAVGADGAAVVKMVLRQGIAPVVFGIAIGLALSAAAGRLLAASFPLSEHVGPALYGLPAPILLLVAMLAAFVPARRAARVDPMMVLRDE